MRGDVEELGFADLHLHQHANLAFGGRVIAGTPSGEIADALASCRAAHGPHGILDLLGNVGRVVLLGAHWRALLGHGTTGYPAFDDWLRWDDLTHQGAHEDMLRRAVDGGLRLVVMHALHNELVYRLTPGARGPGNDMAVVDLQLAAAHQMEASIDARSGGHGRGWYRIVRTPEEAREVIASGRLAVVLGIEVDTLFATPGVEPTPASVRAAVAKYHDAGVRHVMPCHLRDNAFGGAAFALLLHWSRSAGIVSTVNPLGSLPVYRMRTEPGPTDTYRYRGGHRNPQGLTDLGGVLVDELMAHGFLIDVDHMSAATRADVLDRTGARHYPVVAGHAELLTTSRPELRSERQLTDAEVARIEAAGGVVALLLRQSVQAGPATSRGTSDTFAEAYRHLLRTAPGAAGGFGSDLNGFAGSPGARAGASVQYPFPSPVGTASMPRATLGTRTFDIADHGVAHAGMLPDFVAELRVAGLAEHELAPLLRSATRYVEMWERAMTAR